MNIHSAKCFIHYKNRFCVAQFLRSLSTFFDAQHFFFISSHFFLALVVFICVSWYCAQFVSCFVRERERKRKIVFLVRRWTLICRCFSTYRIVVGYFVYISIFLFESGCVSILLRNLRKLRDVARKANQLLYRFGCLPSQWAPYRKNTKQKKKMKTR